MRWHANGHLWQVNHYIDDQEVLPTECWYYSHSEYAYNDPDGVAEAPDWYEYKYQASVRGEKRCVSKFGRSENI